VIVHSSQKQLAWVVVAWAMLVTPALPQACECPCVEPADACGRSCCAPETPAETCCCQLDVGQPEPLLPERVTPPSVDAPHQSVSLAAAQTVPQVLGVSREYLAASLTVPIRPVRILFGVWRD
jgi:hypothetical protein